MPTRSAGNSFSFWSILKKSKFAIFCLSEDHQFWVNLRNIGIWRHDTYTSEQALIIRLYLRCELSTICNISFIHSVQDNLPQFFIEPIGFTVEIISEDIILRHCCVLGFCVKCLAKWAAKISEFLLFANFSATSWKCYSILFLECFGYIQCKRHRSIYMLPFK